MFYTHVCVVQSHSPHFESDRPREVWLQLLGLCLRDDDSDNTTQHGITLQLARELAEQQALTATQQQQLEEQRQQLAGLRTQHAAAVAQQAQQTSGLQQQLAELRAQVASLQQLVQHQQQ